MPLFNKNRRYKVSRRSDYIQLVNLLDGSQMECNLTIDSTALDCLENVLQRLEVKEMELFALRYVTVSGQLRWADPEHSLKRQLEKEAETREVSLGVFYYIERAHALADEAARYQYFLQLKSDVLEGRIVCSLEQAILLGSYALQAEYQSYDSARQSEDYIREIERLDSTLLPRSIVGTYDNAALADIAQHVVSSHMSLSGLSPAQAEISYIHLAEQMDGYGIEYSKAVAESGEEVYLGNSHSGIVVRRPDGHVKCDFKRSQITELTNNKKLFGVSVANKKLSAKFILEDIAAAKYIYRIFSLQHEFHLQSHDSLLLSDFDLGTLQDTGLPPNPSVHISLPSRNASRISRERPVDVKGEDSTYGDDVPTADISLDDETIPPDVLSSQRESDYATIKFNVQQHDPAAYSTHQLRSSLTYLPQNAQLDGRRLPAKLAPDQYSGTNLTEDGVDRTADNYLNHYTHQSAIYHPYTGSREGLAFPHAVELDSTLRVPSYRPTPDYETALRMKDDSMQYVLQNSSEQYMQRGAALSMSQPDISEIEPLYANIQLYLHQVTKHLSEVQLCQPPVSYSSTSAVIPKDPARPPPAYDNRIRSTPDLMRELGDYGYVYSETPVSQQVPDITTLSDSPNVPPSPDIVSRRHLKVPAAAVPQSHSVISQSLYRSFENLVEPSPDVSGNHSIHSSSASSQVTTPSDHQLSTRLFQNMSDPSVQVGTTPRLSQEIIKYGRSGVDERVTDLEERLRSDSLAAEYESLFKKRQPADCRVALRPENAARNRFPNVLPYEDTRVRIKPTQSNPGGYINASHIQMSVGKEQLTYIATQNPLPDTIADFWHMVWQHNVSIITMVTELEERGQQKCPRYLPKSTGVQNAITVANMKVVLQNCASSPNFTTSCLKVLVPNTKEQRTIWHIQHTDWQQSGCPKDVHGFLAMLDELNSVRLHIQMNLNIASPCILVHCSTGVGRSGVVILSDIMRKCLEHNEKISVSSTLKELRQLRMYMVQTFAQYKFVHEVLIQYLRGVRLI